MPENKPDISLVVDDEWTLIAKWDDLPECYLLTLEHDKGSSFAVSYEPRDLGDLHVALELLELGRDYLSTQ